MTQLDRLVQLLSDGAVWRMRDLAAEGITGATVQRAAAAGVVRAVSRGTYRSTSLPLSKEQELASLMTRAPDGILCLYSAAALHELGAYFTAEYWVAVPNSVRVPKIEWPIARFMRWRNPLRFEIGIEVREMAGVQVRLTHAARTVVDLLSMPDIIDENAALDVLRDYTLAGHPLGDVSEVASALGVEDRVDSYVRTANAFMRGR